MVLTSKEASLFPYQEQAVNRALRRGGKFCLFADMRTGKTRMAFATCKAINRPRILVVCPLSVVSVWRQESKLFPWSFIDCTEGSIAERAELYFEHTEPAILVVGYESYWRNPLRDAILKHPPDIIIYDEAHRLRGRSTKQSRFSHVLHNHVPYRLALTGTPIANGIENLFSIYKAIDDTVFGKSWQNFQSRYLNMGGYGGYQIVSYRNTDEVEQKLAESSFRISLKDARGEPEIDNVVIDIELSDKARKAYEELRKYAIAEVEGRDEEGNEVRGTALSRIVLTNIIRLQQVTSGFIKIDDGRIVDVSDDKLNTALDITSDVLSQDKKAVIFCRYTRDIDRLREALSCLSHRVRSYVIDGRNKNERDKNIEAFWEEGPAVLIAEVAVASLGIDLSCADTAIFYSLDFDLINYTQSRARMLLNKNRVTFYHLVCTNTVDEKVYRTLANKESFAKRLLDRSSALSLL